MLDFLGSGVALVGFGPIVNHSLTAITVIADLDREVGVGVAIVSVASFVFLKKLNENFFVHPRLHGKVGFIIALEFKTFFVVFVGGRLLKILHDEPDDFLRPFFHPLDIKIDFSTDLMFRDAVFLGGIRVSVVAGTAVAAGNDDALSGFFLDVVEEFEEDGVDVFFAADDGKAMTAASFAVGEGDGFCGVGKIEDGWIERASLTAEKIFGNAGQIGLRFPGVGGAGGVNEGWGWAKNIALASKNSFPFAVEPTELLSLRLLHARTSDEKKECD